MGDGELLIFAKSEIICYYDDGIGNFSKIKKGLFLIKENSNYGKTESLKISN